MRRWLAYIVPAVAATGVCAALFGPTPILCLHYPVRIENDPLVAPVRVTAIDADTLTLADGRAFRVGSKEPRSLARQIRRCGYRVDVEELPSGVTLISAPVELTRCGTPWTALINIPLFADPTPRYWRKPIAWQEKSGHNAEVRSD